MSEHRTFKITKPKRLTILILVGLLVAGVTIHIYFRYHIAGVYYDPYMACDCSYVFKDGQIFMQTEAGRDALGTFKRVTDHCVRMDHGSLLQDVAGFTIFFSIALFEWWIVFFASIWFVRYFSRKLVPQPSSK